MLERRWQANHETKRNSIGHQADSPGKDSRPTKHKAQRIGEAERQNDSKARGGVAWTKQPSKSSTAKARCSLSLLSAIPTKRKGSVKRLQRRLQRRTERSCPKPSTTTEKARKDRVDVLTKTNSPETRRLQTTRGYPVLPVGKDQPSLIVYPSSVN